VSALQEDDLSAESLERYYASWQKQMGAELQMGALLRKIFLRLEENDIDRILHLLGREPMKRLLTRYGDIDHPSRVVTQLVQVLPKLSALPMVSALFPGHEDLAGDVFALVNSSR
jgi:flavin-dependent dehydrogenase